MKPISKQALAVCFDDLETARAAYDTVAAEVVAMRSQMAALENELVKCQQEYEKAFDDLREIAGFESSDFRDILRKEHRP